MQRRYLAIATTLLLALGAYPRRVAAAPEDAGQSMELISGRRAGASTVGMVDGSNAGADRTTLRAPTSALPCTITVNAGDVLQNVIDAAPPGAVICVNAGTYTAIATGQTGGATEFHLWKAVTLRSNAGAAATVLTRPATTPTITLRIRASNVTLEGFTINGATTPLLTFETSGGALTNIQVRNLIINPLLSAPGHGIHFQLTSNSIIDRCTVSNARFNGIFLAGSNDNLVINNAVQDTVDQHAIAVQNSNGNRIVSNWVTGSGFSGIILLGSDFSRIEKNDVTGYTHDGITITDGSDFNAIIHNHVAQAHPFPGSGIWLNSESNGNLVYGNDTSGAPETGLVVFVSSSEYLLANEVTGNAQGGIFAWEITGFPASVGGRPRNLYIHHNRSADNITNGEIIMRDVADVDIAWNYLSGTGTIGGDGGYFLETVDRAKVYQNTIADVERAMLIFADTTEAQVYRNRHLNAGERFVAFPAGARFDASFFLGGNFWSDHPTSLTPFTDFIFDGAGNRGRYIDEFPYQTEGFARPFVSTPSSLRVAEPSPGQVLAGGTRKTIRWESQGCTKVDIFLRQNATLTPIVANAADTGYYRWTVPLGLNAANFVVRVDCNDSAGNTTGLTDEGEPFTIRPAGVTLLTPGRDLAVNGGSTLRASWSRGAGVGNVNVFTGFDGGPLTLAAGNVEENFVDLAIPGGLNTNRMVLVVRDTAGTGSEDGVDGYFTVRSGTASVRNFTPGQTLVIGQPIYLTWISLPGSVLVDLEFFDGAQYRPIASNLPDIGHFTWLVPDWWTSNSNVRVTFKNTVAASIGSVVSPAVNLRYFVGGGSAITRFRLYNDVSKEHLFTIDQNEYNTLPSFGWVQEGASHRVWTGPAMIDGIAASPIYRLFSLDSLRHLYTTDRNEYFTLRPFPNWNEEHTDGYMFPVQVTGTVPLFRLLYPFFPTPLHTWTIDTNEYNVLPGFGWVQEGIVGYVLPP